MYIHIHKLENSPDVHTYTQASQVHINASYRDTTEFFSVNFLGRLENVFFLFSTTTGVHSSCSDNANDDEYVYGYIVHNGSSSWVDNLGNRSVCPYLPGNYYLMFESPCAECVCSQCASLGWNYDKMSFRTCHTLHSWFLGEPYEYAGLGWNIFPYSVDIQPKI